MKAESLGGLSPEEMVEAVLSEHKPSRNPLVRAIWVILGIIFVFFAYVGVLVPGWPTTSWLVAAAFCFARSSPRLFRWLLTNPVFGKALLNYYRAGKALPLHSKIVIIGMLSVVSILSIVVITRAGDPGFGQTIVGIVALVGVWFVGWKVPTIQ